MNNKRIYKVFIIIIIIYALFVYEPCSRDRINQLIVFDPQLSIKQVE